MLHLRSAAAIRPARKNGILIMDARLTKAEAAFLLPFHTSRAEDARDALRLAAGRAFEGTLAQGLARVADAVLGWPARAEARAELNRLTDRELADIGLTRGDIPRVVAARGA